MVGGLWGWEGFPKEGNGGVRGVVVIWGARWGWEPFSASTVGTVLFVKLVFVQLLL